MLQIEVLHEIPIVPQSIQYIDFPIKNLTSNVYLVEKNKENNLPILTSLSHFILYLFLKPTDIRSCIQNGTTLLFLTS